MILRRDSTVFSATVPFQWHWRTKGSAEAFLEDTIIEARGQKGRKPIKRGQSGYSRRTPKHVELAAIFNTYAPTLVALGGLTKIREASSTRGNIIRHDLVTSATHG